MITMMIIPALPLVGLCGSLGEAEALVLGEEGALAQLDVVDLVARVASVDLLPWVGGQVAFAGARTTHHAQ